MKTKKDDTTAPVIYAKLTQFTLKNKILSLFTTKGKQKVDPFDFLEQYCQVKMALLIESIFISKL